jgi:hypothetical protein
MKGDVDFIVEATIYLWGSSYVLELFVEPPV